MRRRTSSRSPNPAPSESKSIRWKSNRRTRRSGSALPSDAYLRQPFSKPAHDLYDLLLKPAAAQLRGKTRLLIVPDGALWEPALPGFANAKGSLSDRRSRHLLCPSLTVLREMINARRVREARSPAAPTLLALGAPALERQPLTRVRADLMGEGLDPLPEAKHQVRALAKLYGRDHSKIYVGPNASEEQFKAEAKDYDILHLATHGILNDRSPMYSHLLLAQPSDALKRMGCWRLES